MKIFAITYPTTDTPGNTNGRSHQIAQIIDQLFTPVSCEFFDGLAFIKSDLDAHSILTKLKDKVEPDLNETIYVMELANDFASCGTTKVINALDNALQNLNNSESDRQ